MMMMKVIPVERLVQELLAGILHRDDEEEVTENLAGEIDLVLDLENGVAFLLDNEIFSNSDASSDDEHYHRRGRSRVKKSRKQHGRRRNEYSRSKSHLHVGERWI